MINVKKERLLEVENQINKVIFELEKKVSQSSEEYVKGMLTKYKIVRNSIDSSDEGVDLSELKKLLNGARGYMEISSNYSQDFLNEMGKMEKLIKSL